MTKSDDKRVPVLRFKGFTDEWEQRKLGEVSKITAGGDVDKEKLLLHGKFPVIANALTNDGIVGYYNDTYRITAPAVTVTGRGEIGKAKARKNNFTPVVRLLAVESKHNVDFLAEAINRSKVVFESTGVPQLTVPKLSNYKILFPNSIDEEIEVGNFLSRFDSLITLQQRKEKQIKLLKQAMFQTLFTNKNVPQLRFKGFTDNWEQRKLGDLTQRIKSYPISHDAEINKITGTKYIHYGDIHTGKLKRITNEKILPNINDNNYIPLKSGDVIVADASEDYKGIADACVIDLMKEHYKIVSGLHTIVFRPNEKLKSDFLYTYLHTSIFKHYGYRVGTGLKVFGISYNNLSNMKIKLPKIDEQNKVDKIINIVTNLVTLQQNKTKKLENLKQFLLQNMFI